MAGRKPIITMEESAPASPLRRSSRISSSTGTPISGRRNSATAVEAPPVAKIGKGKRLSLSQDNTEERPSTPKRTTKITRAASNSPTAVKETVGTPAKRSRKSSVTKTEEDKSESTTPSTVSRRRRSSRGQSTSPTSDKAEPVKPRGRRTSVTEKIAPLVPIEETDEVKKPATRARRTSLSRRASVEESDDGNALDKRVLTVQLTQLETEVKKTPGRRGRPSKAALEEVNSKKAKIQELNPIIETSFTEESQEKIVTRNKESPNIRSKSPKKSLSVDKTSPLDKTSINNEKSVKTLFDKDVEEENFELTVEDNSEDSVNKKHNENKSAVNLEAVCKQDVEMKESIKSPKKVLKVDIEIEESTKSPRRSLEAVSKQDVEMEESIKSPKKVLKEDIKIEESTKSPRGSLKAEGSKIEKAIKSPKNDLKETIKINESTKSLKKDFKENNKIEEVIKSPKRDVNINQSKIEDKDLDHDAKKDSNKELTIDESEDISKAKIEEDTEESMDLLEVSSSVPADKSVTILPENQSPMTIKSRLSKSFSESVKVLTPNTDKLKSLSSENLNKSKLKDESSFKSPKISKKKTDDPLLINPLEMTFGSDGSFHLNLSIPASNNSLEKNENKSKGSDKLNTTGGSDNSDKENLASPLSSPEKTASDKIKDFSVLSVESKMNTSTPRISLNSSKTKSFSEDKDVEYSNLDSSLSKSIDEDVVSTTRKSLGNVSKLIEEEKEFSSSPIKKIKPIINKVDEKASDESKILDSFVDEVTEEVLEEEDLDEEEITKILETPKSSPTRVQSDLSSEQKKTDPAADISEVIDVETAVTIIKGSPKTKRLSLKLNKSSEECLIEEDNKKSTCVQEHEDETKKEILEATSNEKDTVQTSHISKESSSTPEKKQNLKESPVITNSQKKRLSRNTEETPNKNSQVDLKENAMGNKNKSPCDKKLNTQSPKLVKSSVEQNVESENKKSQEKEELASAYKNPKLVKSLVDETVIIVDDDVASVSESPKRKSLKLKTSSTDDSPNLNTESEINQSSQSDKGSNEDCQTRNESKKKKRRSKKMLECARKSLSKSVGSEEIIEIDEDSSEVLGEPEESNDVEFINEKNLEVQAEFVENISPKKKCKKDKRKSKTIEIKDDTNTTKEECKATSSKMDKKIEESIIEDEIVDLESQDSAGEEIVVVKSSTRPNKGSKRIKRDIALMNDENVASKTDVLSTNEIEFDDINMKGKEHSKTTPSQMTNEGEEPKIENEPVEMQVENTNDVEVINDQENSVAKSPIISSKGSKRIKRDIELVDENVTSKTDIICNDSKISKTEKRMSQNRETLEEIEVTDSPCQTPLPSSKKKRKSLKKQKAEEKANVILKEEESNEVEFVGDSNKEEKLEKISPVTETKKSKRVKKALEEETVENNENEITNISINSIQREITENEVNSNKTPKKEKRRSQKRQIENDLFGDEPSNKEEFSNVVLSSKGKSKETKQKTDENNEMEGYSGESDSKDGDELAVDLITTQLVSEDEEEINSDESYEDFVESVCDFVDYEAVEGSPESSPSHSNDIIEEGESLHSSDTEEEYDLIDEEDYENDSFIDDDVSGELLSGNEYDLCEEKTKKRKGDKTKKKSRIFVLSDSEEENKTEKKDGSKDFIAPQVTEDENVDSEENTGKINIIQNIVISPHNPITENNEIYDIEEIESEKIVEDEVKTKTELKLLSDTPNNSSADTSTSKSNRKKSKRKTSISIQDKLPLTKSTDVEINEKISKAVDFFCSSIKDKTGKISLNVSLDYANNSNSSEDADRKVTKREIDVQEVIIPSIEISQPSFSSPSKSKKRYSLQEQFTILSESPDGKRRRSALPKFTISENSNRNKRKSVELLEVIEPKKKSRTSLTEPDSVQEIKSKKTKAIQPGTNVQYLPEDILAAVVNSSPKVTSSEIIDPRNSRTIKKKKIKIAPSVKMNPAADWEIDEVATKPSKNNKKGEQKLSKKLQQYTETFPSNDFKNRTLYNPKRNRRQDSKQLLANKKGRI